MWKPAAIVYLLAIFSSALFSGPAHAATKYASPTGRADNDGNSASTPWNSATCFTSLAPGDRCIYLPGNYGRTHFMPAKSGVSGNRITHECQTLHGCSFDRIRIESVAYLTIKNIKSDTNYYDPTHTYTNPRAWVQLSHDIKFDSIYVRGEPERCAPGNPGPGCAGTEWERYNDLFQLGSAGKASYNIEITGNTHLIDGNHDSLTLFDDSDTVACEPNESNVWVHGTETTPIVVSMRYHHNFSIKGACRVLIEHVDFRQAGSGRGDLQLPHDASDHDQAGEIIHGADFQHAIVRFASMSQGGSGTAKTQNSANIGIGNYGSTVNGACFAHLSHYRPWGAALSMGRMNDVASVQRVSILNNAVNEAWHMATANPAVTDSPYKNYILLRTYGTGSFSAYINGLVAGSVHETDALFYNSLGAKQGFGSVPLNVDGVQIGSNVKRFDGALYRDPSKRDFTPLPDGPLVAAASPIALTTNSGTGTKIKIDRPECFMGTMGGMRSGDVIDINSDQCTVVDVNLANSELTCSSTISWAAGEAIYYKPGGTIFREIGARRVGGLRPRPPRLQ